MLKEEDMSRTKLSVLIGLVAGLLITPGVFAGDNASAIEAYVEVWNNGKVEMLDGIAAVDLQRRSPAGPQNNLEEVKAFITETRNAYSDLKITNNGVVSAGDEAVLKWTFAGTHLEFGKAIEVDGVSVVRFTGGKMAQETLFFDNAEILKQLGFTITSPTEEEDSDSN